MSDPKRMLLAGLAGGILGVMLAGAGFWLAGREQSSTDLPRRDAKLLSEVLDRIRADYVERTDDHKLMSSAIRGMVGELDPHSMFMDAGEFEELKIATEGNYSGIGVEVTLDAGAIVVISPIDESPAARAGIRAGDRIVAVDGKPVEGTALADSVAHIRGEPGTIVKLKIGRQSAPVPLDFAIERAVVSVHSVRHEMLEPGYGYLRISQFSDTTGPDFDQALEALQAQAGGHLRGIVLDLRNNPGGVLDAAVEVSDAFLERGIIVTAEGRAPEASFRMDAAAGDLSRGARIAVLVNEGSASAAEIVAGALHDNGRATLLGRKTFGKGSVQTVLPLTGGQALKLTTSRYFTPSGVSIHERGIEPDIALPDVPVPDGRVAPVVAKDPDVRAAIAWLKDGSPALAAAKIAPARR
ncbi:MAG: S41 family peptidase [Steroidobacteraceae bacterium]